jgi:hypothetical protein
MILEVRTVGRKTPGDGRLEVSELTQRRLRIVGQLRARVGDDEQPAALDALSCDRCSEREHHVHHFLKSDAFRALAAGESCVIELHANGVVEVSRPHPLAPVQEAT